MELRRYSHTDQIPNMYNKRTAAHYTKNSSTSTNNPAK